MAGAARPWSWSVATRTKARISICGSARDAVGACSRCLQVRARQRGRWLALEDLDVFGVGRTFRSTIRYISPDLPGCQLDERGLVEFTPAHRRPACPDRAPHATVRRVNVAPRRARWLIALAGVIVFALLRLWGGAPRWVTADEADAFLGAKLLVERLAPAGDDPTPWRQRLKAGFETTASHPRLAQLPPDKTAPRAALEAPVPRWLGAAGLGLAPTADDTDNLVRASVASSLAVALALMLVLATLRSRGALAMLVAGGALLAMPGVTDSALSGGHGAAALLVSALFAATLGRVLAGGGLLAQLGLGLVMGLALGVHPLAWALYLVVLIAWAIRPPAAAAPSSEASPAVHSGTLPLPGAPVILFALPVIALVVLIAIWPALWADTGKRLGAWLFDFGSTPSPRHEVLDVVFDQATGRSAQAFTAVLQWVAWTPLPVLALWLVGVAHALGRGRDGAWAPILMTLVWLAAGALDGGLFGARNSLLAMTWVPTAITAGHGAVAALSAIERRLATRPGRLARWSPATRALAFALLVLVVPALQAWRGTTLGLARQTGAELRVPIPVAPLVAVGEERPWSVVHAWPAPAISEPGLDVLREGLSIDLRTGPLAKADLLLLATATGSAVPPEVEPRLANAVERARDPRPGLVMSLFELPGPAPLDKRPALPHK